jgi:hypothetical protein
MSVGDLIETIVYSIKWKFTYQVTIYVYLKGLNLTEGLIMSKKYNFPSPTSNPFFDPSGKQLGIDGIHKETSH